MTAKTRQQSGTQPLHSFMDFEDQELQQTLNEFLEDEKKEQTNIWNFATISGVAMFIVILVYLIQMVTGLSLGPNLAELVEFLPILGGVLVTLVGFGFFVGDRKREKQARRKKKKRQRSRYDFNSPDINSPDIEEDPHLKND